MILIFDTGNQMENQKNGSQRFKKLCPSMRPRWTNPYAYDTHGLWSNKAPKLYFTSNGRKTNFLTGNSERHVEKPRSDNVNAVRSYSRVIQGNFLDQSEWLRVATAATDTKNPHTPKRCVGFPRLKHINQARRVNSWSFFVKNGVPSRFTAGGHVKIMSGCFEQMRSSELIITTKIAFGWKFNTVTRPEASKRGIASWTLVHLQGWQPAVTYKKSLGVLNIKCDRQSRMSRPK